MFLKQIQFNRGRFNNLLIADRSSKLVFLVCWCYLVIQTVMFCDLCKYCSQNAMKGVQVMLVLRSYDFKFKRNRQLFVCSFAEKRPKPSCILFFIYLYIFGCLCHDSDLKQTFMESKLRTRVEAFDDWVVLKCSWEVGTFLH